MTTTTYHNLDNDSGDKAISLKLLREDEDGIVYLSAPSVPDMFIALNTQDESAIRSSISRCLKCSFTEGGKEVYVRTHSDITGPIIAATVEVRAIRSLGAFSEF